MVERLENGKWYRVKASLVGKPDDSTTQLIHTLAWEMKMMYDGVPRQWQGYEEILRWRGRFVGIDGDWSWSKEDFEEVEAPATYTRSMLLRTQHSPAVVFSTNNPDVRPQWFYITLRGRSND